MKRILEVKNLKKSYGETHALNGVDVDFNEGEFVVVIGPIAKDEGAV